MVFPLAETRLGQDGGLLSPTNDGSTTDYPQQPALAWSIHCIKLHNGLQMLYYNELGVLQCNHYQTEKTSSIISNLQQR
eukprot:scaffold319465_cov34-Prasinocladus_malaysianus.AAC.1